MTAPAPDQQPVDQPPQHDSRDLVLAALALWFASAAAISATRLPIALYRRLVALGLSRRAVRAAELMTMRPPLTGRRRHGSPAPSPGTSSVRTVAAEEPMRRAQYLINAAERLSEADELGVMEPALRRERVYLDQHTAAGRRRAWAARRVDQMAMEHGPWMVWVTKNDDRVEAECRDLAGTVFTADNPPKGLYPGAAHPTCRCWPAPLYDRGDRSMPPPPIFANQGV